MIMPYFAPLGRTESLRTLKLEYISSALTSYSNYMKSDVQRQAMQLVLGNLLETHPYIYRIDANIYCFEFSHMLLHYKFTIYY